jgi:hypothetical protein
MGNMGIGGGGGLTNRNSEKACWNSNESYDSTISKPPGVSIIAILIQNPPNEEREVAPNVFPIFISLFPELISYYSFPPPLSPK